MGEELEHMQTCKMIRAILLTVKGGTTAEKLYSDYRDMVGEGIPYRRLGYDSLNNFLKCIPDHCRISRNNKGEIICTGVADDSTRHMQDLIAKTKSKKRLPVKGPTRRPMQQSTHWNPPQHQPPPMRGGGYGMRGGQMGPRPFGRGGGLGPPRGGMGRISNNVRGIGRGRGNRFNNNVQRAPLREPRGNFGRGGGGGPRGGGGLGSRGMHSKQVKSPPRGQQQVARQSSKQQTDFKGDLENYFTKNNLGEVPYKVATVGTKGKEKFMATVTVEGTQFKTYPQTYNSRVEAEEAVAAEVVKKMGILADPDSESSLETSDPSLYSARVAELLGTRHNGVWSTQVEKEYQAKFGEKLPSLWYQEAEALNKIRVDCPVLGSGRYIVFPAVPNLHKKEVSQEPRSISSQVQPPQLEYPTEELWDVYVTYLRSTTNVSVRLIGSEYSELFDDLSSDMDIHYYDKTAIPGVGRPEIGKLYAAHVSSDWHRVKVVELRGIQATCVFLDHGDQDTIPVEDLREIAPKFLELPAQAINITLSGLEDYEYNENIVSRLNENLLGKSLVAKVDNRTELSLVCDPDLPPRMVLFDTSSEDVDVNINQKLIELLISEDYLSRLPQVGGEEIIVRISYIADTGDIYVQKEANTYAAMEKLLSDVSDKLPLDGSSAGIIGMNTLYLARNPEDSKLYRAELVTPEKMPNGRYHVFFVDFGSSAFVESSQIYDICGVNNPLSEMPRLAFRCRLEGVPPEGHLWSREASNALREMVPLNELVKLKVLGGDSVCPRVELHHADNNQGSINFDLSTEFDIFPAVPTGRSSTPTSPMRGQTNGSPTDGAKSPVDHASQSMSSLSVMNSDMKPLCMPTIPPEGEQYDVKVTCAVSPSNFIIQPYSEMEKLQTLMADMDTYFNIEANLKEVRTEDMVDGQYFAGRHSDGYWYRVRVTKCIDALSAAVRLVDYGDLSMLNICDMQPLCKQFRQLPLQAINAKLANIQPVEGDWRPEDTVWFSNRVADREFVSVIKKVSPSIGDDFECVIELLLIDTSHPLNDQYVDQELVEDKRALPLLNSDRGSE